MINNYEYHENRACENFAELIALDYVNKHVANSSDKVYTLKLDTDVPKNGDIAIVIENQDGDTQNLEIEVKSAKWYVDGEFNFSNHQCETAPDKIYILMGKGKKSIDMAYICWFDIADLIEREIFTKQSKGFRFRFNAKKQLYFQAGKFVKTSGKMVTDRYNIQILKVYLAKEITALIKKARKKVENGTQLRFENLPKIESRQ